MQELVNKEKGRFSFCRFDAQGHVVQSLLTSSEMKENKREEKKG
jgi:hypothetical protein